MNKRIVLYLLPLFLAQMAQAQAPKARRIDTVAVQVLDKMSATIGDLHSCSVAVHSNYDVVSSELGLIKHSDEIDLYLQGPNKVLVRSEGDRGSRSLFYNGSMLTYYSMDKNQFAQVAKTESIIPMIDTVSKEYGIEFPAADFFYPNFVDDIIGDSRTLVYLGLTRINGKECYHIAGVGTDKTFQFWIANDAYYLPLKMVIVYTDGGTNRQYEATLNDWQINPSLPDAIFEFTAPPHARKIKLAHSTSK